MEVRGELLFVCLLALVCSGWAARRVDANARARDTMKRRRETAVMQRQEPGTLDTTELLQLTQGESLAEVRSDTDAHGTTVERMQETFRDIPIMDSIVTVRKDDHGHLTGDASGTLVQDIADDLSDIEPAITDEETLTMVIQAQGDEGMVDLIGDVTYEHFIYLDSNDKARLVSKVAYAIDGLKNPNYIIDLKSGEILRYWNSFRTVSCCHGSPLKVQLIGGNEKMGEIRYGSQPYCLDFTVDDCNNCYLENKYVRVVDMQYTSHENITETASFPCNEIYDDSVNGAYSPAIDAFFYGTVVGQLFEEWFDSTALKDKIIIRVHYGQNYSNAFWNSVNATFGDGGDTFYPLVSIDVVGHELGHGVVEQASSLFYYGESGGMDEAFADIMGEVTEGFVLSSDYMTGNDLMRNGPYLREFENPSNDNVSIGRADQMTADMDPHLSSGVYRRVWYVITKEQQMDVKSAFRVFLYANNMYWHYMSTFYDASCGLLRAAMDLGIDTAPFAIAFEDVGIAKCNVSDHIVSLSNNRTQRKVKITESVQPVFAFSAPAWAEAIYVEAVTPSLGTVRITLLKGSWEDEEYDNAEIVAEGYTKLEYMLELNLSEEELNSSEEELNSSEEELNSSEEELNSSEEELNSSEDKQRRSANSQTDRSTDNQHSSSSTTEFPDYYEPSTNKLPDYYEPPTTEFPDYYEPSTTELPDYYEPTTTEYPSLETTPRELPESSTSGNSENVTTEFPPWMNTTSVPAKRVEYKFFIKLSVESYYDYFDDVEVTAGYICSDSFVGSDFDTMFYRWYCSGNLEK